MKNVIQLDDDNYYVGITIADESPLEPGIFLIPRNAIDVEEPNIPDGHRAKWDNKWIFEEILIESELKEIDYEAKAQEDEWIKNKLAAINHAKSLGFTDDMIAVMFPGLGGI